jgi:hypothetical protein
LLPENTIQWNYPPEYAGKIGARHMTDAENQQYAIQNELK